MRASGSRKTVAPSSKETPGFRRFALAFFGSHSNCTTVAYDTPADVETRDAARQKATLAGRLLRAAAVAAALLERCVEEGAQCLGAGGVAELAERFRLDLADPLAGDVERAAHFLQRVLGTVAHAEAHLEHLLLARGEGAQDLAGLLLEVRDDHVIDGGDHAAVLDEIAEMRVFLFSDRSL